MTNPGAATAEPNDVAAEQCVLGGMMLSAEAIADVVRTGLGASAYYRPAHQLVHEAILALYNRGDPVDAVMVGHELAARGELERISGATYLHTLISQVPAAANAGHYARIVAAHAERREWLAHASRIMQVAADPGSDLASVRELAGRQPGESGAAHSGLLSGIRDGAWLDKQEFPELRYAVPGLIPEGSALLVGAPKIGKSWFVLTVALAISSGGVALSAIKTGPARPALYLALEDSDRRMQDRCRKLLGEREQIPPLFSYLTHIEPGKVVAAIAAWLRQHEGEHPFVIIDTLGKVMPTALQGESSYQRDYRVGSALKRLVDDNPGATLLTNHHDRKAAAADFIDSVSGTHGLAGAADTILVLTRDRNDPAGLLQVTGRDVLEGEYAVTFAGGVWELDGDHLDDAAATARTRKASAGLGGRSADAVAFVNRHADGARLADIAEALGLDSRQTGVYLGRLVKEGRIAKRARGLYGPVESVESVESAGQSTNTEYNSALKPENTLTSQNNTPNTFNTSAPGGCPRHQRFGPHPHCLDCQALADGAEPLGRSCARCGGVTAPGFELCLNCERSR